MTQRKYRLITADAPKELEISVNTYLDNGWEICGNLIIKGDTFVQPMVRPSSPPCNSKWNPIRADL